MRLPVNRQIALFAPILLAGCMSGASGLQSAPPAVAGGPSADYPVVVGDPFTIDGTTYTPEDVMNYDAVGYAMVGDSGRSLVTGAHKTLPLPSYVEVTNLETGRTILVRLDTRGPMRSDVLIGLSPAAASELAIPADAKAAVRVRRVNPPEPERAMLRSGEPVPARMDTPASLLNALKRKLGGQAAVSVHAPAPPLASVEPKAVAAASTPAPVTATPTLAKDPPLKPAVIGKGTFVQLGAFSSEANAHKAAKSVDGSVSKVGKFWVARLGPLAGKTQVDAALAKARAAGYADAMIRRVD